MTIPLRCTCPLGAAAIAATAAIAGLPDSIQVNVDDAGDDIVGDAANEPSIGVDPTAPNRIAIGWRQFDTIASSFREAGWGWSHDGGRTWTFPGAIEDGIFRSDPVLGCSPDGQFLYYSLKGNFTCDLFRSDDGAQTWPLKTVAFGGDKAWMTVDSTDGVGRGNVYVTWSTAAGPFAAATFIRSVDGGATFQPPVAYPTPPRFGTLTVGRDGEVFVSGVQSSPYNPDVFLCVRSVTAQDPMLPVAFDQTAVVDMGGRLVGSTGPNPAGLLGQVNIDVNRSNGPHGGEVYMLCSVNPPPGPRFDDPLDVHFSRSVDGGLTWSAPVRINDDQPGNFASQWFGTLSVAPNGRIDVVWNDTRNAASQLPPQTSELFHSFSDDGGRTWSPNVALSAPFNHFLGYPQQNKLGDYYHMVSDDVGAHLAWAATFNGGQDVYYLRIGDYDCNGNGVGDEEDLARGTAADCDDNGIPDSCEIAAGTLVDTDGDGVPDVCDDPADVNGDGQVDGADLGILLAAWGGRGPADLNGDGVVDGADLGALLAAWSRDP